MAQDFANYPPPEDIFTNFFTKKENEIKTVEDAVKLLQEKKHFCNFLYSNSKAHPLRDKLFYEISKYKKIDSLGKHLNNTEIPGTGYEGHASECAKIKSDYKFSIACENAWFPGYTTEKILTSLVAHTVPIYWGNKDISADLNPACFINVMDYSSMDEVINAIRKIDEDNSLWCQMIAQPWYTNKQIEDKKKRRNDYYQMMLKIFTNDINSLKYRGIGTAEYLYHDFYYRKGVKSVISKILNRFSIIK